MPSEKMLEDLQKIGITADRIVKISNLKKIDNDNSTT